MTLPKGRNICISSASPNSWTLIITLHLIIITLHYIDHHYITVHCLDHYITIENWPSLHYITLHYIDHHYNSLIIITIQNVTITSRVLHLFFSNGLRQIPEKKKLFFFQGFPKYHWKCNLFVNVPFISNKWLGQIPKTSWLINAKGNIWIVNFLLQHSNRFWAGGIAWCIIIMTMFLRLVIIMIYLSGIFKKKIGPNPLWSQSVQDRVAQKSCF